MKIPNPLTSACRYCRHYQPEGRRGGMCQQLGAQVQGCWKACALAMPQFAPSWEDVEPATLLKKPLVFSIRPIYRLDSSSFVPVEQTAKSAPKREKAEPLPV